jgi:predicted nicotinamide N-methyase
MLARIGEHLPDFDNLSQVVLRHTEVVPAPLCPELKLHLMTPRCLAYAMSEQQAATAGLVEPWWAFAWPGGQALARLILDRPELVRGTNVLDFGSGCAIEGIAAARAGAASVSCADIDPIASVAAKLNADLGSVQIDVTADDLIGSVREESVILAGDVFYDRALADRAREWLRSCAARGALVLVGDPSRGFLDTAGLEEIWRGEALRDGDLSGADRRLTMVYRLPP